MVWPAGQVVTLVSTMTVVTTVEGSSGAGDELIGEFGVEEGVGGTEAPVKGMEDGQLVIRPGFWGTNAAQIPMR
jgi:hypothetical protein